jgi:hypothetical protein
MRKLTLILGLMFTVGISNVLANEEKVSAVVLESFKNEFSNAQNVSWVEGIDYYRAAFLFNGQNMFAIFSMKGELLSMDRNISSFQLPLGLFNDLKNIHKNYWITDLFEVSNNEGTHYYVTLENADTVTMLSAVNGDKWKTLSKKRKL